MARAKQRYDADGTRLVAGCVPVRIVEKEDHRRVMEVLLVSAQRGDWVFPKGGWENFEDAAGAAARETFEEAGVEGAIVGELGVVDMLSSKKNKTRMHAFLMNVNKQHDEYPERDRTRSWVRARRCSALRVPPHPASRSPLRCSCAQVPLAMVKSRLSRGEMLAVFDRACEHPLVKGFLSS
jgi:8-oxo-dGTP pyrophosphatase MutT (NUDIX family)